MAVTSRREYEMLFKLTAALGPNFGQTFSSAMKTTKQLQGTLSDLKKVQSDVSSYQKQQTAMSSNQSKLSQLNGEHDKLQSQLSQTAERAKELERQMATNLKDQGLTKNSQEAARLKSEYKELSKELESTREKEQKLQGQLKSNEGQMSSTNKKIEQQKEKLTELEKKLKSSGINTNSLTKENEKLQAAYERVATSQERLAKISDLQQRNSAAISATRGQLAKTIGVAGALGAAIYAGPVQAAMSFESSMAEVSKVIDWINKSGTPEEVRQYKQLKKAVLDVTTQIPMTSEEIAQIMAAAGQANVASDNAGLVQFTKDAAQMGIAFDVTAEQAGEWMAKWRTSFGMTQAQVVNLSDKINYLGNTSAANARQISEIVTKIGPLGEIAGLASGEIAALGATMVAVGVSEDVAATGIKKVITTMTAGDAATNRQQTALDSLGLSASTLAKRMQKDAKGAILDFMAAVKKLPKAEQTSTLKMYFGEESVAAISPLLTQLELLQEQFSKVGDASRYAGSMEAEYAALADTTENKVQLAKNSIAKLTTVLGDTFLPLVGKGADKLTGFINRMAEFAERNPQVVSTIAKVTAGMMAFKAGSQVMKLGFLQVRGAGLIVEKGFALIVAGMAKINANALTNTGRLKTLAGSVKAYFTNLGSAGSGVLSAFNGLFSGSRLASVFSGIGNKMGTLFSGAFSATGSKLVNILGATGRKISSGPISKVASIVGKGFAKLGSIVSPIGKLIVTALGPLGGLAASVMPVIGVVVAIISAVQLLMGNLETVRSFIESKFGSNAVAVFDKIINSIRNIGSTISKVFSDSSLGQARDYIVNMFGGNKTATKLIDGFFNLVKSVRNIIGDFIAFVQTNITPIVQELLSFIVDGVLPKIAAKLSEWAPGIISTIQGIWTIISSIAQAIINVVNFLMPTVKQIIGSGIDSILGVIGGLIKAIQGIVDFVAGVFTGDWQRAWEGVKNIFAGIFEGLKNVVKVPINLIIGFVNTIIRGLNKIKLPSWVPKIGGKGINIPEIPMLAKGSRNTPDTFIAGEKGPELITNAPGRVVYTANQTVKLMQMLGRLRNPAVGEKNIGKGTALISKMSERTAYTTQIAEPMQVFSRAKTFGEVENKGLVSSFKAIVDKLKVKGFPPPPALAGVGGNGGMPITVRLLKQGETRQYYVNVTSNNNIYTSGDPQDIEETLKAHDAEVERRIDEKLKRRQEDERRRRYD